MIVIQTLGLLKSQALDDQVQSDPLIQNYLLPVEQDLQQETKLSIKLVDLRKISMDRHAITHQPTHSVTDQRLLLNKYEQIDLPNDYSYKNVLEKIIDCLQNLDKNPTQTRLRSFR